MKIIKVIFTEENEKPNSTTSRATEATMTLDMVLEAVLGHVTHAMMRATARGTTYLACHDAHAMVPRHL